MYRKRLLLALFAIVLTVNPALATIYHGDRSGTNGEVSWRFDTETGILGLDGTGYVDFTKEDVPWYSYRSSIKEVQISDGITGIGKYAFYECRQMTSVSIPNSVTRIRAFAFWNCYSLQTISIPSSLSRYGVGEAAFDGCFFTTANFINNSSVDFEDEDYYGATICDSESKEGLLVKGDAVVKCRPFATSVTVSNASSIDSYAFKGCDALTSVFITESVKSISSTAFEGCSNISTLRWRSSADPVEVTKYCKASLSDVVIFSNFTSFESLAFKDCTALTSIALPGTLTSIGNEVFKGCSSLSSIYIPSSVSSIGRSAFENCSSLTTINIPSSIKSIGGSAFSGCTSLPVIDNLRYADTYLVEATDKTQTSYTIKDGTKYVGIHAFYRCSSLESITIPSNVVSIEGNAFQFCEALKTVRLNEDLKTIGINSFGRCTSLTNISIPNSVEQIGDYAFIPCM